MNQLPCPNCGEVLACAEEGIGRTMRCPRCRALLRLDADARPVYRWPRRRFPLLGLTVALLLFLAGLAIGFQWGATAARTSGNGITATSFGFFGASNTIVVDDHSAPPPKAAGGR